MFYSETLLVIFLAVQLITKVSLFEYGKGYKQPFRQDYVYYESTQSYYKLHTDAQTWFEAKKTCASEGAILFYPEDQNETELMLAYTEKIQDFNYVFLFIGISDLVAEGVFETVDGRKILDVFHKWDTDEPNNFNDQDCVILERNRTIGDYWCTRQYPFFCKKRFDVVDWTPQCSVLDYDGRNHSVYFRKDYLCSPTTKSFYKVHTISRLWSEAKDICKREGATFFYPENKQEADIILAYLNQNHVFKWIHLGISDLKTEGAFVTVDDRRIEDVYNNWDPGQPNNNNGREHCVMLRDTGTLTDESCDWSYPFICKKTIATLEWNHKCNMPYFDYVHNEHLGKCYKFHSTPLNWTDASAACDAEDSYLAVINSRQEAQYLVVLTNQHASTKMTGTFVRGAVHLGFHNQFSEGWTTVKATSLVDSGYLEWAYQQPDGRGRDKCGSMFYDGGLNDIGCEQKAFYICEHDVPLTMTSFIGDRFDND